MRRGAIALLLAAPLAAAELRHDQEGVPAALSWRARLAPAGEPGSPLVVSGTVFAPDGRTPAAGVTVYAYHTDATGLYHPNGVSVPPRLRGWMKSDAAGRFELRTIRPAPYPSGGVPAHVHFVLFGGGYPRQWTDELVFDDDPSVNRRTREHAAAMGGFGMVRPLVRGDDGILRATVKLRLLTQSNFE
ncbi:MAG TPA: protocatechuate 3,4-dioxygenase [Vicinamibacteria bacterium]|nr:protocatechuate 3,4-dioxygenase [Vicinamibacteria bacterium]